MTEKRFTFSTKWRWILFDNETEKFMDMEDCKDKLNEQQVTIEALLLDRDRQEEKLDIARRNMAKQLEKIEELQKKNAQLTERLRECRMRLDRFNCR